MCPPFPLVGTHNIITTLATRDHTPAPAHILVYTHRRAIPSRQNKCILKNKYNNNQCLWAILLHLPPWSWGTHRNITRGTTKFKSSKLSSISIRVIFLNPCPFLPAITSNWAFWNRQSPTVACRHFGGKGDIPDNGSSSSLTKQMNNHKLLSSWLKLLILTTYVISYFKS